MMESTNLSVIITILNSENRTSGDILRQAVEKIGETLNVDRCCLCVRDPSKERCQTPIVWRRNDSVPSGAFGMKWVNESSFVHEDPLYRAALAGEPSLYITDVETAPSEILNREFEDRYFGHRAFIHAHIVKDGQLWGTLEPCVFDQVRQWTESERTFIEALLPLLAVQVEKFVTREQIV